MTAAYEPIDEGGNGPLPSPMKATGSGRGVSCRRHGLAAVIYVVLAVALTWPLTWHIGSKVVMHPKRSFLVPYHHLYLFAWYHHVFDQGLVFGQGRANYWNANMFYPHPRVLTYCESLLAPAAMTWPVHVVSQNVTLCYNLVVLSAFFLNGLATYVLALQLGLSWRLALVAGGALAFCPYMLAEIYCPAMLLLYPVPLLLAAFHRLIRRPTWTGVVLVGLCGLWLLTTCYQYTLFCSVFCVGWMLWFVRQLPWRRLWYKLLITGSVCAALSWPLLSTVSRTHRDMGFSRTPELPMTWLELLTPAIDQPLYRDLLGIRIREERGLRGYPVCFPGLTVGLLAAVGAWAALFGPAKSEEDRRRRHAYRFCVAASLTAVALAMGLWISVGPIEAPGPYWLLFLTLSPFGSVRSEYRFYIFGHLFAAILAGLGLRQCCQVASTGRLRKVIGPAAVLFLLAESTWIPLNLWQAGGRPCDVHPLYRRLAELDPNAPLIELPVPFKPEHQLLDSLYVFSSIHTWQPLVNGYAGYTPGLYEQLRRAMTQFPSNETIRCLQALGVRYVLVRGPYMPEGTVDAIKRFPSLRKVAQHQDDLLYELTGSGRRSLSGWDGETRFRIDRDPESDRQLRAVVGFQLDRGDVIPVLPGDRGTRWELRWRDGSGRVAKTQFVSVRDSHWLTFRQNVLVEAIDGVTRPGTYTVEAVDRLDARGLGSCKIRVR